MALEPGDEITVTLSTPIHLSRFVIIKPFASVRRAMGGDPEADEQALRREVKRMYLRNLAVELSLLDSVSDAIGEEGTLADVQDWCIKELEHVDPEAKEEVVRRREEKREARDRRRAEETGEKGKGPRRRKKAAKRKPTRRKA